MFNKFAKIIRWSILIGMLYTLYVITIKDDIEFKGQTDEKVLLQMAEKSNKSKDKFIIYKQLITLFPNNKQYQEDYHKTAKQQANALIDAHEKMLVPLPIGNYRYIKNIKFGQYTNGDFVLILNMTDIFNKKIIPESQETIANMLRITHRGMYEHFGFENSFKLVIIPTFHNLEDITIINLARKPHEKIPQIPTQGKS